MNPVQGLQAKLKLERQHKGVLQRRLHEAREELKELKRSMLAECDHADTLGDHRVPTAIIRREVELRG